MKFNNNMGGNMTKVISKKDGKLVSINGKPLYQYRVTTNITELTEWYIESDKELSPQLLEWHSRWRETRDEKHLDETGGKKKPPYGTRIYKDCFVDVGHGPRWLNRDSQQWEFKQLVTEYTEDE